VSGQTRTRKVAALPKHGARKVHLQVHDGAGWHTACPVVLSDPQPLPDTAPVTCRRCVNSPHARPSRGHEPIVTPAPALTPRKGGPPAIPMVTMLRCSCGWHGGQVSILSPGNGGRAGPALRAHNRHVAQVLAGDGGPVVPWWLTVEQAIAEAELLEEAVARSQ
jgi:hypothetical protein